MLVALLTGVFDPPPDRLVIPWFYILGVLAAVGASMTLAVRLAERRIEVSPIVVLREELSVDRASGHNSAINLAGIGGQRRGR